MPDFSHDLSGIVSGSDVVDDAINLNTDTAESGAMHRGESAAALSPPTKTLPEEEEKEEVIGGGLKYDPSFSGLSGLEYDPSFEVCCVGINLLLRPGITLGDKLAVESDQLENRLQEVWTTEGPGAPGFQEELDEANTLYRATQDLVQKDPAKIGRDLIIYGEATLVDALYDRGLCPRRGWYSEAKQLRILMHLELLAPIRAGECYELLVLKEVFISLYLLCWAGEIDGGMCDMIQYIIYPTFRARMEVELRAQVLLYREFHLKQVQYEHCDWVAEEDTDEEDYDYADPREDYEDMYRQEDEYSDLF